MKKFLTRLFLFGIVLFCTDRAVGLIMSHLEQNAKGGVTHSNYYILNELKDDVLIFGSSRCVHHYIPEIIQDSLKMSCYNCGTDGNGIIMMYGMYKCILERYTPKVVVYELYANFDFGKGDNSRYLKILRRLYNHPGIDSIVWSVDQSERYKLLSEMYRYNGGWMQMLADNIKPMNDTYNGYMPYYGEMNTEHSQEPNKATEYVLDSLKIHYLKKLIEECRSSGTKLIFALSPCYTTSAYKDFEFAIKIAKDYDVPLIDHFCDTTFTKHPEYFYDHVHMNDTGARLYSSLFSSELKKILYECFNNNCKE